MKQNSSEKNIAKNIPSRHVSIEKRDIERTVKEVVKQYGETLRLLGQE